MKNIPQKQSLGRYLRDTLKTNIGVIAAIFLMLLCRSAIADWYHVPSGSMLPTIEIGDRITVEKIAYNLRLPFSNKVLLPIAPPERGDIVIIQSAAANERLVKRVVGLPGERIAMRNHQLFIDNKPMQYKLKAQQKTLAVMTESLNQSSYDIQHETSLPSSLHSFDSVVVPEGHYLVLGDNRRNSLDSRYYGFIPHHELHGKVHHVAYSLDPNNYYLPRSKRVFEKLL